MKKIVLGSFVASSLLMVSCVITPGYVGFAPIQVATPAVQVVPDGYVWDGFEYVSIVGGEYMYLGPGGVWLNCEPWRLERFHGWERNGHGDWRSHPERFGGGHGGHPGVSHRR
jgi:hypothetical protein